MTSGYLFTSESVAAGHPDKVCDNISDAILDACIKADPRARVALETFVKGMDDGSYIVLGGEITINVDHRIDYEGIARKTAAEIGYTNHDYGMAANDSNSCKVQVLVSQQSGDISQGVTEGEGMFSAQGAGDQGLMFGFATDESESWDSLKGHYMPLPALLSQQLTLELSAAGLDGTLEWARPDAKSQVTIEYADEGVPTRAETVVIAIQHDDLRGMFDGDEVEEQKYIQQEVTEDLLDAKSSLTPTVAWAAMVEVHSVVKTRAKWIVPLHMLRDGLRNTSLLQDWPSAARFNWLMPSALQNRSVSG